MKAILSGPVSTEPAHCQGFISVTVDRNFATVDLVADRIVINLEMVLLLYSVFSFLFSDNLVGLNCLSCLHIDRIGNVYKMICLVF